MGEENTNVQIQLSPEIKKYIELCFSKASDFSGTFEENLSRYLQESFAHRLEMEYQNHAIKNPPATSDMVTALEQEAAESKVREENEKKAAQEKIDAEMKAAKEAEEAARKK